MPLTSPIKATDLEAGMEVWEQGAIRLIIEARTLPLNGFVIVHFAAKGNRQCVINYQADSYVTRAL